MRNFWNPKNIKNYFLFKYKKDPNHGILLHLIYFSLFYRN
ncbi:unnamed protein product [Nezara viridula]|uniref:Uncharacterized protein n=1 Tax=Nezara viridula TaxID=85310 RepID=A0A9P0E4B2_NEZVI|nr:unnamed protein product [Nezara viridula]CAH1390619.1 unnamed protein product [Nezara viridula]CAH1390620.1 unnamed protein product [Nezara viridula]